jgi:anti-sigma factor RsiW
VSLLSHWRIAAQLPDLMDGDLDLRTEARLRAHVGRCRRCTRKLARLERAEALLARMPRALFPLAAGAAGADGRLRTLAQWGERPGARAPYGPLPAASALAMATLMFVLSVTAQDWAPVVGDMGASTTIAQVMPDSSFYPMTLR